MKAMGGQVQVFAGGNDSPDRVQALKLGMSRPCSGDSGPDLAVLQRMD